MQTVTEARGKMADKVWRTASGIEIAWQDAAKQSEVLGMRKHSTDVRKVLKGTKDIIDFAIQKTGTSAEMFAVVTSGVETQILSVVRIPTGLYLARVIADLKVLEFFGCFQFVIHSLDMTLKWLMAMKEVADVLEVPRNSRLANDSDPEDVLLTMPTPEKKKSTN